MSICFKCQKTIRKQDVSQYGLHQYCYFSWFSVPAGSEFSNIVRHSSGSEDPLKTSAASEFWNSSFFHGKFKKYSAELGDEQYILKVEQDIAPELPYVEYLCNQIATLLNIHVPDYYLIDFFDLPTFVTKNFITALETVATLTHIYHHVDTSQDYNCEQLIHIIEKQTSRYAEVEKFVILCLYDALIGNHDRHGRNLGFIKTKKGVVLAPIYDNTSALGLETGKMLQALFDPKGKIATQATQEPTLKDYAIEFKRLSYGAIVDKFYRDINLNKIDDLIEHSFCSELMKAAMQKLIHRRYEELRDAL